MTDQIADLPLGATLTLPAPLDRRFPFKRTFDVAVALLLLLLSLPLLLAAAAVIKVADGGPVLYRQRRVGRGGAPFTMVKLRTMVVGADTMLELVRPRDVTDGLLFKVPGDPRVTRVGRSLRRWCIDELPQLWNVLRGDMSLVGPRPLAAEPHSFSPAEQRRHAVRPGITGPWQVQGGRRRSYDEMIRLDLDYVRHWSLRSDLRVLLRTVPVLLEHDDDV